MIYLNMRYEHSLLHLVKYDLSYVHIDHIVLSSIMQHEKEQKQRHIIVRVKL